MGHELILADLFWISEKLTLVLFDVIALEWNFSLAQITFLWNGSFSKNRFLFFNEN